MLLFRVTRPGDAAVCVRKPGHAAVCGNEAW
jgi:hypothetical protein